ncbi:hypothetical protein [Ahrensia sp. R2A130]|uniref:hypothetical protein n=1 Tax=Ahrensia sp. R2A130 TaxID=744979 RepID=UPI0001E0E078|nr:hypothetical protein [Ahrensia sp. R2A130]EFL89814.1 conserved hypothetical protein [Ahrensia sp. R2A130]
MTDEPTYERPNTVSGLVEKHAQLSRLRRQYEAEIKKLTVDIDHLHAAIRLFDPDANTYDIKAFVSKHRAQMGSVKRFVLDTMREADGPLTCRQITVKWAEDRGLVASEATYVTLRKRVSGCIRASVAQGLIEGVGWTTTHDKHGPYKLWQLKRGDQ